MIKRAHGDNGRRGVRRAVLAGGALALAAGCAEIEVGAEAVKGVSRALAPAPAVAAAPARQISQSSAAEVLQPGPNAQIDPQLLPQPEDFEARGAAEWDGARTLQGVWIAHPQASSARRVRIVNTDNGFAVDGALFRRDDTGGGPPVIVSSDAAEALGMEPGREVELSIVAVRKPGAAELAEAEAETGDRAAADTQPAEPAGEADAASPEASEPAAAGEPGDEPAAAEASAEADAADEEEAEAPEPRAEPEIAAAPEQPAPPADEPEPAAEPAGGAADAEPAEPAAAEEDVAGEGDTGEGETAFRFETAPEDGSGTGGDEAEMAAAPAGEPGGEMAGGSPIRDGKPLIQAGIFGVPENVRRLIAKIEEAGFPAEGRPITLNGRELTRVVSGPYETEEARDRALRRIREIGPDDATPVAR
jgi:hypothetical protein